MKRHIALLRGINISGKNKVPMAELKKGFEAAGFLEVKTWLNSGNVVFSCEEADAAALADRIERMMQCEFGRIFPFLLFYRRSLWTFCAMPRIGGERRIRKFTITSFSSCRL